MPDAPGPGLEPPPSYTKYRSRPRLRPRRQTDALAELRDRGDGGARVHRGRRWSWQRVLKWVAIAFFGWIALSVVLFLVSAQIQSSKVSDETKAALDDAGFPVTSANNILILVSDHRETGHQ